MIGAKFPASFLLERALPSIATVVIILRGALRSPLVLDCLAGWGHIIHTTVTVTVTV